MKTRFLGVDIGGVIIQPQDRNADTSFFGENYLQTPAMPDAFEVLRQLNAGPFAGRIHLVSKCGLKTQKRSQEWLDRNGFFETTGIDKSHVHFCFKRHQKAGICTALGITHFVDDRLEIHGYLEDVPNRFLFCPDNEEVKEFSHHLPFVTTVNSWAELYPLVCGY